MAEWRLQATVVVAIVVVLLAGRLLCYNRATAVCLSGMLRMNLARRTFASFAVGGAL